MKKFIPLLFVLLFFASGTSAPAQIMENIDQWLQDQIRKEVKEKKDWKWVVKVPSEDHFPTYSIRVNGKKTDVIKFQEIAYADLPCSDKFEIEITANIPFKSVDVSPHSYKLKGNLNEKSFKISLDRPRKLILTFNNNHRLFLFANGPEKYPARKNDSGVIFLSKYHPDRSGQKDATAIIQKAIDDTSKKKETLYIGEGTYRINQLWLKNNTALYLEKGAVLKLTDDEKTQLKIREKNLEKGIQFIAPIMIYKANNVRLSGQGTIDGNGDYLAFKNDFTRRGYYRLVHILDSKNVEVCDLILKNPQRWNSHFANSENIIYENVKIINSINICNTDAIDPDNSRNVLVQDVFAYSSDDSVVVKTSARWHDSKRPEESFLKSANITARNCVFWTRANALKIGTETFRDIENVLFENNDIINAYCAMTIELKEGSKTNNVRFLNNRIQKIGDVHKGRILNFLVREYIYSSQKTEVIDRPSYGQLTNVVIRDFFAESQPASSSKIAACSDTSFIKGILFENFRIEGKKIESPEQFRCKVGKFVSDLEFK
ncbi:MAG: glycosyl hydrolase family 28 protein [Planctomycetia bacterium]|nr:glycosyl hydrolase family 28 protein [Planctomycetia bacterium]